MIVVDTNIISYFYLNSEFSFLAEQVFQKDSFWAVPVLWRSEFRSVLSLYLRQKIIELSDAVQLMSLAERKSSKTFQKRPKIWRLLLRGPEIKKYISHWLKQMKDE